MKLDSIAMIRASDRTVYGLRPYCVRSVNVSRTETSVPYCSQAIVITVRGRGRILSKRSYTVDIVDDNND
jgi:hypothetical protein